MWIDVSEPPTVGGYYLTYYYNAHEDAHLYKAIWFSPAKNEWCKWRKSLPNLDVKCYWNKHFDYYVPCQLQEDVDNRPEKYRPT